MINLICSFQDNEKVYFVLELLKGGDLRYHMNNNYKKINEIQLKFLVQNLIIVLEYIHRNNIIHRDIKPENLVSDENGYIRITDFGVAKVNKEDNSSETSGTPGYMAPEVLIGQNHSFTVDFFAIGVMGYEFMIGTRPYNGKNRKEIKHMVLKKQAKIDPNNTDWSEESVDFINRCLKRKESRRLGYNNGVKELKNHRWFEGYNWEALFNKSILAPFVPKKEGNFDKKYCEMKEKLGDETLERYNSYLNKNNFENLFRGYTYINLDLIQNSINNETHTRFTTNSKQNKPTNSNNYSNKKENAKNNNPINKNVKPKLIANNFNNMNLKLNSPVLQVKNFFTNFIKVENKPVKPEVLSPINYREIEKKINEEKYKEKNNFKDKEYNNKEIHNHKDVVSSNEIKQNQQKLVNSSSILNMINTPPIGKKLKLDKNNSFLNLKGESNLFNNNNNVQNNNHNDTNLSSLLSSNSIVNFNYVSKINSLNKHSKNKEKKNTKNQTNEHSISILNAQNNISLYDKTQKNKNNKNNKSIIEEKAKKEINQLLFKFSCKDLIRTNSPRDQPLSGRNKSNLKIMLKVDNSYRLNSLSPRIKNEENSKNKKINSNNSINREFNNIQNKNYIQLRQTSIKNDKNILSFYLPDLNKMNNNKKLFNHFNYGEFKKKGKINLNNLYNFLKNKNLKKKEEKYYLVKDKNIINSKMQRSGSTFQFNSGMKLEPKINNFITKNPKNRIKNYKNMTFLQNNNTNNAFRERKLRRNASDIF
jgi:serine/threonine protein kinase